jgi:hypothetical protein
MKKRIYLISLLVILFLGACVDIPDTIVAPSWNTTFNIPLTTRQYSLEDIIVDSEYIDIDTTDFGRIFVFRSDTLDYAYSIGNYLKDKLNFKVLGIEIPIIEGKGSSYFEIDQLLEVDSSVIKGGNLYVKVKNNSPDPMEFRIVIPRLTNGGIPFEMHETVAGNSTATKNESLSLFVYSAPDDPKGQVKVEAEIIKGNMNGTVEIDVEIKDSFFEYFKGKIPSSTIDTVSYSIALPIDQTIRNLRKKITLNNPRLYIKANYNSSVENIFAALLHHVQVKAKTEDGEEQDLEKPDGDKNMGDFELEDGKLEHIFNSANSTIGKLFALIPDSLTLTTDVIMNPNNEYGEASARDTLFLSISIEAETIIGIDSVAYLDSLDFTIDDEQRDLLRKGQSALVTIELFNGIALEVDLDFDFINDKGDTLYATGINIDPADVNEHGFATGKKYSENILKMDSTEVINIANANKILMSFGLSTTNQGRVVLSPDDSLLVDAYAKFKIHLDPNDTK